MIDSNTCEQLRQQGYYVEEEPRQDAASPFPTRQFAAAILAKRRLVLFAGVAGLVLGTALGLLRHKKYTATLQVMPPDAAALSTTSTLAALSGNPLAGGLGGGGGLLSSRTPGSTVLGVLGSPAVQDALVERFHLTNVFGLDYPQDARARLLGMTDLDEDKKSGILSVAVTYRDPALARDIANGYIVVLDKVLSDVNTSTAHRERVFLEERLGSLKTEVSSLEYQLSAFSTSTGTLNPQAQGQALIEVVSKVQSELGLARADLSSLRAVYTDNNARVQAARARLASLEGQLAGLGGAAAATVTPVRAIASGFDEQDSGTATHSTQALPTIRQLPNLGVTYANLTQRLTAEQAVYATLTRQYELARVEEAKEIPSVKVLSPAQLPSKPSSPTVLFTALTSCFAFTATCFVLVALWALVRFAPAAMPFKTFLQAVTPSAAAATATR